MAIAPNDVNVLSVETADLDVRQGQNFDVTIEAEAGVALHATGGKYAVRMTGNYGDGDWPNPGLQTFTFTVPGAATAGRQGDILEPQARVINNAAPPFDASHAVGDSLLVTP